MTYGLATHQGSSPSAAPYGAATPGREEELDSSYKKRNHDYKKFFRPGRVFLTLSTEPNGEAGVGTFETYATVAKGSERLTQKSGDLL